MSTHIGAKEDQIAKTVLMPGDPQRAKYIAEKFLHNAECYNTVRGMLGFTGTYKGKRVSVQGSGMGIPSSLIYANELLMFYGVKNLIRVGTAGAIRSDIPVRDIIIAQSACTTSAINKTRFLGYDFAPTADFGLLMSAYKAAEALGIELNKVHVGSVLSSDEFYGHDDGLLQRFADYGVLAVEMEAAGLYTIAPKFGAKALTILTVSDNIVTGEQTTADERERSFEDMMKIALEIAE